MGHSEILNNRRVAVLVAVGVACCLSMSALAQNQGPTKWDPSNKLINTANGIAGALPSECDGVADNLITNCGFETGNLMGWTQSGDLSFTDVCGPTHPLCMSDVAHSGDFGLRWGPTPGLGCIEQTIPTTSGMSYQITFWLRDLKVLAGDPSQRPNNFQVFWNNVKISGDLMNLPDFDYGQYSLPDNVAGAAMTPVKFCALNTPDFFSFDDVAVVQQ